MRPGRDADVAPLRLIRNEPGVIRWWNAPEPGDVEAQVHGTDPDVASLTIEVDGEVAGLIQYGQESAPEYRHANIDIYLGAAFQGRGIGALAVWLLARYLFDQAGHHRITIDPEAANERAIRCYGRVGFRPVGVLRRYQRLDDGTWADGMLMDLLAGELVRPADAESGA